MRPGDLVRHKRLIMKKPRSKGEDYPLLGMVVRVHDHQGYPPRQLATVHWIGTLDRLTPSSSASWQCKIIPSDNLVLQ